MTNGTLAIYQNVSIDEKRNFMVENMDAFLLRFSPATATIENIFIKTTENDIDVKAPLAGSSAFSTNKANYACFTVEGKKWYYFIRSCKWVANNTLSLEMHIDSLNTWGVAILNAMTSRSTTLREHRTRFVQKAPAFSPLTLLAKVDKTSEGFNCMRYRTSKNEVLDANAGLSPLQWYLIYITKDILSDTATDNVIQCYLAPSEPVVAVKSHSGGSSVELSASSLQRNTYYYLSKKDQGSGTIFFSSTDPTKDKTISLGNDYAIAFWTNDGAFINWAIIDYIQCPQGLEWGMTHDSDSVTSVILQNCYALRYSTLQAASLDGMESFNKIVYNVGSTAEIVSDSVNAFNFNDPKIVKIITLPYEAVSLNYDSDGRIIMYHLNYDINYNVFIADTLKFSFGNSRLSCSKTKPDNINVEINSNKDSLPNFTRFLDDTKLLHSDFHTEKFIYDNFSYEVQLEQCSFTYANEPTYKFYFQPTNTINSNLLFEVVLQNANYESPNDYDFILSSRNNEATIFSDSYLNYLKTGYNYDKKSKGIEATGRWLGVAISVGETALGVATENAPLTIVGAMSMVSTITSAIVSQTASDNAFASKQAQMRQQAANVSGTDDIDLLKTYNGNRLLYETFDVNSVTKAMLNDLFYYCGYATNRIKKPEYLSRYWFNFVQCLPDFSYSSMTFNQCLEEITQKFKDGVTFFHYHNDYDLAQSKENWETWIIDHG